MITAPDPQPKPPLPGLADYTGDQIRVEPKFPPTPRPPAAPSAPPGAFVKAFDYADLPGHALVTLDGPRITAKIFPGLSRHPGGQWTSPPSSREPSSPAIKNPSTFDDCCPSSERLATRPGFRRDLDSGDVQSVRH